jgi:hypothetical protein
MTDKMDLFCRALAGIDQEDLGNICDEECLSTLRTTAKRYISHTKLAMKKDPESKSTSEADTLWIQKVTGVNMAYRQWTDYVIDEAIHPGSEFKAAFENIGKTFHQQYEGGRRIYLNLILSDIILRPEFEGTLRIFPDLEVIAVQTNGSKKRKLTGKADYTVGLAREINIFDKVFPCEAHLVVMQIREDEREEDWEQQCIPEVASLHKNRVDAGKVNTKVWGILSNATHWKFFFIDESHFLWQSDEFSLNISTYVESKMLHIYRLVHYIVKCCYEANTLPSSSGTSISSISDCA